MFEGDSRENRPIWGLALVLLLVGFFVLVLVDAVLRWLTS